MASADGYVRINTKVDTSGAKAGLGSLMGSLKGFAAAAGLAFGVKALIDFGKQCIDVASDLNEVQNVVDVTFGSSADKINAFATTAATSFGLSALAAKQYTGTMGAMFKSMGFGQSEAADMSIAMAGLAGDMASFYNLSTDEAFAKIRSGISGETEPLKQLGINLSEANLSAFALKQGITGGYTALSEQNKALIRYNYLLETTSDAQGDFQRTSSGWANQIRILGLQFSTLKGTLGGAFIAVLAPVLRWINQLLGALNSVAVVFANFVTAVTGQQQSVTTATEGTTAAVDDLADSTTASGQAAAAAGKAAAKGAEGFDELNIMAADTGSGSGGSGAAMATTAGTSADTTAAATPDTNAMAEKLKAFFEPYQGQIDRIIAGWNTMKTTITDVFNELVLQTKNTDLLGASINVILNYAYAFEAQLNLLLGILGSLIVAFNIPATVEAALNLAAAGYQAIGDIITAITPGVQGFVDAALVPIADWLGGKVRSTMDFFAGQLQKLGDWFTKNKDTFTEVFTNLGIAVGAVWDFLAPILDSLWSVLTDLFSQVVDGAMQIGDALLPLIDQVSAFVQAFMAWAEASGVLAALQTDIGFIGDVLGTVIDIVVGVVKSIIAILGGLMDFLTGVFTGDWDKAWKGITEIWQGVADFWKTIGQGIADFLGEIWNQITTSATAAWNGINEFFQGIWVAILTKIFEVWNSVTQFLSGVWNGVFSTGVSIFTGLSNFFAGIWTGIQNTATGVWNSITGFFRGVWSSIASAASGCWSGITSVWSAVSGWFQDRVINPLRNAFQGLKDFIGSIWSGIWSNMKSTLNWLIGGIESFINGIARGLNGLINGINKVVSGAGKALGLNISIPTVSTVSLPRLAQGAVIPPNRAFAAILGDQKHGTNIETPLDTMLQAFRAAFAEAGDNGPTQVQITFKGDLAGLAAVLAPEVTVAQNKNNRAAGYTLQVV